MQAEVRITMDRDKLAFARMRGESGLWVVTVNAGHIVKAVQVKGPIEFHANNHDVPTTEEILDGDGTWLLYTRTRFIRSAIRVPQGRSVDEMVEEIEESGSNP